MNGVTFYLTTGLDDAAVMKSGNFMLTEGQVRLLLASVRDGYGDILTDNVWNMKIEGVLFSTYIEEAVKDMAVRLLLVNMLADEMGIRLSEEEIADIKNQAQRFYNNGNGLDYIGFDEVERLFVMMRLSDKTYDALTQNVDTEISIDEARIIKIQYIYAADSMQKLRNAQTDIKEGYEFLTVAAKYSESVEYSAEIGRGEMEEPFEEAAFNLDEGQVSGIVTCSNGYYIIKCINDNVEDKAESQREKIIQSRREEQFAGFLADFSKEARISFDEKLWEDIVGEAPSGEDAFRTEK